MNSFRTTQDWQSRFDRGFEAYKHADYVTAFRELASLADEGYDEAQLIMGLMYQYENGVDRDETEAAWWYRLAAEQGNRQPRYP